jgi:membrane-associated phospholipid phosphatase
LKIRIKDKLSPAEIVAVAYILITAAYILCFYRKVDYAPLCLASRFVFLAMIVFLSWLAQKSDHAAVDFVRYLFPLSLITVWYPETSYLNGRIFPVFDEYFAAADNFLFGCQPSLEFSRLWHSPFVSELMSFGYFSFYLSIAFTVIYFYFDKGHPQKAAFLILFSFCIYYLIFILLPVVGPQYYFPCDRYPQGFGFYKMLTAIQFYGEKPTGAFPSSHIGISMIILFIFYKRNKLVFRVIFPIFILLALSTVYIKAHYVVDVIGGALSAPILYYFGNKTFDLLKGREGMSDNQ